MTLSSSTTSLFLFSTSLVISTSLVVALSRTWRIALLALLVQYMALGLLSLEIGPVARGGLRILVGSLVCLVLFLTARYTQHGRRAMRWPVVDRHWVSQAVFRLAAVSLAGIGIFGSSIPDQVPSLPGELVMVSVWLMTIGLVIVLISQELLWAGVGLLTVESGFETLYTALDPRLEPAGLLAATGLLLALGVAVVVTARSTNSLTRPGK